MLHVHQSNRLERLADELTRLFTDDPPAPFVPETVVVQSHGAAHWLQWRLADALGICANVSFPFPAEFIWGLFGAVLSGLPEISRYTPSVLTWRIMDVLADLPGDGSHAPLAAYLESGEGRQDERRRHELAGRIAGVFDQYLLFRPDWIRAWERGEGDDWQARLWRRLVAADHGEHWVHAHDACLRALADEAVPASLPGRVSLFGLPALTPAYLEVIERLARRTDVHLFLLNPCRQYWGQIANEREQARLGGSRAPESLHLETGHALLASLGRPAREFIDAVLELPGAEHEYFEAPAAESVLHLLQADILDLRDRGQRGEFPPLPAAAHDESVQIHACHSAMREVEVLHDRLLAMFESAAREGRALTPSDILVITPGLPAYAPYIEGVFGAATGGRHVPYRVMDRGGPRRGQLTDTFFALLELPDSRLTAEAVLSPLEVPAVQRRFDLDDDDLARLRRWTSETNVRWAWDAAQRQRLGLPATQAHTWSAGLDRLLMGFAMSGEGPQPYAGILPYAGIEGDNARLLSRFLAYLDALLTFRDRLAPPRRVSAWTETLKALLHNFFEAGEDEADEEALQALREVLSGMARDATLAAFAGTIGRGVVGVELEQRVAQMGRAAPAGGGVTFADMASMRGLPHKLICLIGMNDRTYPRLDHRPDFDRMASEHRRGDRVRRDDDRYLFLEMLLAARECLYISYVGSDQHTDESLPPSVLVSELLDVLRTGFTVNGEPADEQHFVTRHPLQAFSRRYFDGRDRRLYSYRAELCVPPAPADTLARPPLLTSILPLKDGEWRELTLRDLVSFFRNPARFLLTRRLGIDLRETTGELAGDEPFAFENYADNGMRQRLTDLLLAGHAPAELRTAGESLGTLPHGQVGERLFLAESRAAMRFAANLRRRLKPAETLALDLEIGGVRLTGAMAGVTDGGLQRYLARDKTHPALQLECWVQHLALNVSRAGSGSEIYLLDDEIRLRPVSDPGKLLKDLLALFREGLTRPLHFFPRSALEYIAVVEKGGDGLDAARRTWEGDEYRKGECEDAHYRLAFGDTDPLDAEFETLARCVCEPLRRHTGSSS
ncbi:MAG TPA: exodeoxyribonuclease V subunit gamma [Gammaproteobacteria bacterium]|nr:exodeoxyribonuclease V subunit gamma [Gammaproteobacteria bacterium]